MHDVQYDVWKPLDFMRENRRMLSMGTNLFYPKDRNRCRRSLFLSHHYLILRFQLDSFIPIQQELLILHNEETCSQTVQYVQLEPIFITGGIVNSRITRYILKVNKKCCTPYARTGKGSVENSSQPQVTMISSTIPNNAKINPAQSIDSVQEVLLKSFKMKNIYDIYYKKNSLDFL